jgi:iron complex outermembrane receptor protein
MNSNSWSRPASLVAAAVALALGHSAWAQTALGEITVTARKRAESVQDVPFAISARSGEQLRDAGATNIEDVSRNIAGFSVQNLGPGQNQVAIRGVSAGQTARDLPGVKEQVGVYIDESVISLSLFTPDLELYDLSRIEVLRGPQGTLFGSGSLSGTVRYISNQPDLSGSYGDVEVTGSSIDGGDAGGNVSGMFNTPMGSNAALRVVGYYSDIPGFIDAVQPGGSKNQDVDGGTRYGFRAAMRFEPSENLAITPRVIYQKVDMDGFNRTDAWNILGNPYTTTEPRVNLSDREQYTQLEEKFKDEFMLADLTVEAGIGDYKLTSITSYTDRDILVVRDATQLTGSVTYDIGGGSATSAQIRVNSPLYDATKLKAFTQELRLASDYEGSVQWLVGAFYSDIQRDYGQTLPTPGYDAIMIDLICGGPPNCGVTSPDLGSPTDTPFYSRIPYDFTQKAVFAEVNFGMGERANLAVGARYFDFKEDRVLYFGGLFADSDGGPDEPTNGPGSAKSSDILPRVLFSYDVNDNVQLNAQVSEGFRLGGINDPLNLGLCDDTDEETYGGYGTFGDENLWNYELGAKIGFADGRAQFNVSVFDAEIDDLQVPVTAGTCSSRIILNVKKSHSQGVEMEFVAQPTDHFDFGFSATLVNSELDSTFTALVGGVPTVIGGIEKGNRMASVPEFQMAANATYKWQLTDRLEGYVSGNFQHVGDRYTQVADQVSGYGTFDIRAFGDPTISSFTFDPLLPEYEIANLRFGVRGDDWEAALFINNLADESAKLGLDRERGRVARVGFLTNQPRTFGVTYRRSFGK